MSPSADNFYTAPRQPPASQSNPFESQFETLPNPTSSSSKDRKGGANPFAVYDDGVEEDEAESGNWESEPVGTRSEGKFWQPKYYSAYFDINASDFLVRLLRSIIPIKPILGWGDPSETGQQLEQEEETQQDLEEWQEETTVPDLYGPVWITTTLVLTLSMGSKLAEFLLNVFHQKETTSIKSSLSTLEFSKLWHASSILYFYVFIFPLLLTLFQCLFIRRNQNQNDPSSSSASSSLKSYPIVGTIMVYGYSMTPVVVASLVTTIPIETVQIIAMGVAFTIGAFVIMLNLWRDVSVQFRSLTYFVRIIAVAAHAGVGFALVYIFFLGRN